MSSNNSGRFGRFGGVSKDTKKDGKGKKESKKLRFARFRKDRLEGGQLDSTQSECEDVSISDGRHAVLDNISEKHSQFEDFFDDGVITTMTPTESRIFSNRLTASYLKEKENRKWVSENEDALSDLDEGDEDDERTESASNNLLGGSTQGQSKQQNEQKLSDTILKQIQKTIDSMGRSENTLTKSAYYMAKLRDLTSSNNTSQLREIADRGGIVAIVSTMRRHLDEDKSSRVELKARQKDDESLYYRRLQQLGVACLANLARQAKLISDIDSQGGTKAIFDAMRKYPDNANLQEKGLCAICCYARLDDKRKGLLESHDTIKVIVVAMTRGREDVHVQKRAIVSLHRLSSAGSDTCSAIGNSGGVDAVLVAMRGYPKDEKVQMLGCALLKALCRRVEANKTLIVSGRGLAIVLHAMKEHETNPDVQEDACRLFGHLSNCHLERKFSIARSGALDRILQAMKRHPERPSIQIAGCVALLNLTEKLDIAQMTNALGGALDIVRAAKVDSPEHARTIINRLRLARYAPIVWMS
ncbi:hypothetical protein ACA910_014243 [Epithemia clementina (nom. ined.)]